MDDEQVKTAIQDLARQITFLQENVIVLMVNQSVMWEYFSKKFKIKEKEIKDKISVELQKVSLLSTPLDKNDIN